MNLIEQQNVLKGLTDESLAAELSNPSGATPPFLIASEVSRRKSARERYEGAKAKAPATTVLQDLAASQPMGGMMGAQPTQGAPAGLAAALPMAGAPAAEPMPAFAEGGLVGALNYDQIGQRYADTLAALPEQRDRARALALLQAGAGMMAGGSSNFLTNLGKGVGAGTTYYGDALNGIDTKEQNALQNALQLQQAQRGDELSRLKFDFDKTEAQAAAARAAEARNHFSSAAVSGVDENGNDVTARFNTSTGDYAINPRPDGTIPTSFTPYSASEIQGNKDMERANVKKVQNLPSDTAAITDAARQAQTALDTVENAYNKIGFGNTGPVGQATRALSFGAAGADVDALLQTLKSGAAATALQAMRDASKTGGALGNVSDSDIALLQTKIANLDSKQSEEQLKEQLGTIYRELQAALGTRLTMLKQTYAKTPGAEALDAIPMPAGLSLQDAIAQPDGVDPNDALVQRWLQ